jgi:1,2-diacylglycerol 3-alpha-glucosyltransferase
MRIALFTDNFYPELTGIGDSLTLFSRALVERGHQVLIVAPRYKDADYKNGATKEAEATFYKGIQIERLPSVVFPGSPTSQGRIVIPYGKSISILKKFKPDIIHTNSPFGVGIDAWLAAIILKIPMVGTNHTIVSEFVKYGPIHGTFAENTAERFFSWYYNRCKFITGPCKALIDNMRIHGLRIPARSLSNPVALELFYPPESEQEKQALKRRLGFSPHTIIYAGRLASEKCIDILIKALPLVRKEIPDAMLVLVGHGANENELRTMALNLGLAGSVKFMGFIPLKDPKFRDIYQASDIFSIMSTSDTQSLTLMQAFATGIPAVGAKAWGLAQYIPEGGGIVVEPGDIQGAAQAFIHFFKNPDEMKRIGAISLDLAKKFSPAAIAAEWEKIYSTYIKTKK